MSMNTTVGCKVEKEVAQKLKAEAELKRVGVNHILRDLVYEHVKPKATFDDEVWGDSGLYDDMLDDISGKLGKDAGWLVSVIEKIVDGGYLVVGENGEVVLKEGEIIQ